MCGICGALNFDDQQHVDRSLLERMNQRIFHRGPDSDGFYQRGNIGLAMRRLAIVDLVSGDQPIANETGEIWTVFNGEIFNYPALRPVLEKRGHIFRTQADTEAIVHLYEDFSLDFVQHLRGQFAIAIFDERRNRLVLARDRLGQKPLYYTRIANSFYFASELKSILEVPGASRDINYLALDDYLTLMWVPDPWTPFEGIYKLPPAHLLVVDLASQKVTTEKYWDLNYEPKWDLPDHDIRHQLRETITEAVRIRLMSDVPLGAHLSGGLDSTIVVGLMAEMMDQPVKTFSIGFPEARYDETPYAKQVAARFGTDHHEFVLEPDAMGVLFDMMGHFDEPFADPAALPTWYLAKMTREHVTVALNGDGGDEAFAGYQRYFGDRYVDIYRGVPRFLRKGLFDPLINLLPVQSERPMEQSVTAALRGLSRGADVSHAASKVRWSTHFNAEEKWRLYNTAMRAQVGDHQTVIAHEKTFHTALAKHRVDRTLYTDIHLYLPGALLPKVDRMTMAQSLEARSPFLDHEVMELAARLPVRSKLRGQTTKWILRDLFADLMPPGIGERGKSGFSVPLGPWFQGELFEPARELLLSTDTRIHRLLIPAEINRLLEENLSGRHNHGKRIWTLMNLEVWMRRYL